MTSTNLEDLIHAFPENFQFYHLGEVKLAKGEPDEKDEAHPPFSLEEVSTLGFQVFGDLKLLILVSFPKDLDLSVYSELGNILASKFAHHLIQEKDIDIMISAPQVLTLAQTNQLMSYRPLETILKRNYSHLYQNLTIPISTWILPTTSVEEGVGHA